MNDTWIITVFVMIDDVMKHLGHQDHVLAHVGDAEELSVAVVAAKYFQNHHERALGVMKLGGYLSGQMSISRFNRRLHARADWLELLLAILGELAAQEKRSLLITCRCRCVSGRAPGAAAKCADATTAGMVRPKIKSSSVGGCP